MIPQPGDILLSHNTTQEPGLWFVFYSDEDGIAAFDLTREHQDIGYSGFSRVLNFEDTSAITEQVVLLGGPERPDDALIVLHETSATTDDSHLINDQFSFLSYNYVRVPGKPPAITTPDNRPSAIKLKKSSRFLVSMGYRIFDAPNMLRELKEGSWICLPATTDMVFNTSRHQRRAKALRQMN